VHYLRWPISNRTTRRDHAVLSHRPPARARDDGGGAIEPIEARHLDGADCHSPTTHWRALSNRSRRRSRHQRNYGRATAGDRWFNNEEKRRRHRRERFEDRCAVCAPTCAVCAHEVCGLRTVSAQGKPLVGDQWWAPTPAFDGYDPGTLQLSQGAVSGET
jgi:hypothetical protein